MHNLVHAIDRLNTWLSNRKAKRIILVAVISINAVFYTTTEFDQFPRFQRRRSTTGFAHDSASRFFYFFYYKNLFPLATLEQDVLYSLEEANQEISEHGQSLIMEAGHWSRLGENARILAFMPNALLKGSPVKPSIKLFNALFFTSGLLCLFWGFHTIGLPLIGLFTVFFINITPFYLYEVFSNQNIFALLASTFFIVLGFNLPALFLDKISLPKTIFRILFSGALIAFASEVRNGTSIILLSLMAIYVLSKSVKWIPKLVYVSLILLSFFATRSAIRSYFDGKFHKTAEVVQQHGGHVYTGGRISGHNFWHPVFCGLGDFDTKYGYKWDDQVAYRYAVPILREKYKINVNYSGGYHTDNYYDTAKLYYIKFDEIPEYEQVVRDKVLSDIRSDPWWYISILLKRMRKIVTHTLPFHFIGLGLFPLLVILVKRKEWDLIKLLALTLPLSAGSFIIYSDRGATYDSVFPYFVISIGLYLLYEWRNQRQNISPHSQ